MIPKDLIIRDDRRAEGDVDPGGAVPGLQPSKLDVLARNVAPRMPAPPAAVGDVQRVAQAARHLIVANYIRGLISLHAILPCALIVVVVLVVAGDEGAPQPRIVAVLEYLALPMAQVYPFVPSHLRSPFAAYRQKQSHITSPENKLNRLPHSHKF